MPCRINHTCTSRPCALAAVRNTVFAAVVVETLAGNPGIDWIGVEGGEETSVNPNKSSIALAVRCVAGGVETELGIVGPPKSRSSKFSIPPPTTACT